MNVGLTTTGTSDSPCRSHMRFSARWNGEVMASMPPVGESHTVSSTGSHSPSVALKRHGRPQQSVFHTVWYASWLDAYQTV